MNTLLACGRFISRERSKQKLSLAKLSQKSFGHTHYATIIGKIEKAEKPQIAFDTIDKILCGLGYELKDLFLQSK
jgi:hypothetical protein